MFQFPNNFLILLLLSILIISAIIDFRIQKIPNLITFPAVIIALLFHLFTNGIDGMTFSLLGMITGIGLLIIPYMAGGMGAGDVKLMGVVGAVLGSKGVFVAFLLTALIGGIYAVIITLLNQKQFKGHFKDFLKNQLITLQLFILTRKFIQDPVEDKNNKKPRLCYGVAIALGTVIYMGLDFSGHHLIF